MPQIAWDIAQIVLGLAMLYFGAEWLIAGAAGLARSFGIKPLIIGLTVVAYGTSAPELVVGISAGIRGQGAIALGNVIGSNIANLGLILAMAALIRTTQVDRQIVVRELPVLLATTALVPLSLLDGQVSMFEAGGLLGLAVAYTGWMLVTSKRDSTEALKHVAEDAAAAAVMSPQRKRSVLGALVFAGLIFLVAGGHFLVTGAVGVARIAGMSERIIGLTIVAVGTSIPELATSLVAAVRGHGDIAIGNVVGSNIFNVLLVLAAAGLAGEIHANPGDVALDVFALGAMTLFAAVVMATRRRITRIEGTILLLGYIAFLSALSLQ